MHEIKPEIKPEILLEEKKYLKVKLDLGIKRDNKELRIPGDFILVDSIDGALEVKLDKPINDPIDFQRIKIIRSPFETMYLTNAAQAGKSAVFYLGREASFESEPKEIGKVEVTTVFSGEVISKVSGETVIGKVSGETIIGKVSGEVVKVSGETVSITTPTAVKTGLTRMVTADSGGAVLHSGSVLSVNIKSLSGDVYIGGATDRPVAVSGYPFSSIGFLLAAGEAKSIDIDNFDRIYLCAVKSGDAVSFMGVS